MSDPVARFVEPRLTRVLDVIVALCGLVVLSPAFLLIALAIRRDSPGPILFRQQRVGRRGRPFAILKFRSMVQDAPARGPAVTVGDDPRTTRIGSWLRRAKLDELPQIINVLRGEMSLVGPRPEVPEFVARYTRRQRRVLDVRPGITDTASLCFFDEERVLAGAADWRETYVADIVPEKLRLSLDYLERRSFASDVVIVMRTVARMAGRLLQVIAARFGL